MASADGGMPLAVSQGTASCELAGETLHPLRLPGNR